MVLTENDEIVLVSSGGNASDFFFGHPCSDAVIALDSLVRGIDEVLGDVELVPDIGLGSLRHT